MTPPAITINDNDWFRYSNAAVSTCSYAALCCVSFPRGHAKSTLQVLTLFVINTIFTADNMRTKPDNTI
jgi:hypothetical protein